MASTAADYMCFCKMLANGGELDGVRILGTRTVDYMASNHLPGKRDLAAMGMPSFSETSMEGIGFGLGFALLPSSSYPIRRELRSTIYTSIVD